MFERPDAHQDENRPQKDSHGHDPRPHTHGVTDPVIFTTERGIWAIKSSFLGLLLTALLQVIVVLFSGSMALLADTIHNFGDAATAIPLWIAFSLERRKPNQRFTYGYGRAEDLAGVAIVLIISFSALVSGYESIRRLFHPRPIEYLWAVMAASIIGFLGNEVAATFRIKVGKEIGSVALIADGQHARVDGLASLSVLLGAIGVWVGYRWADPVVGLLIAGVILRVAWNSGRAVFTRLLDGMDPEVVEEIRHVMRQIPEVKDVTEVRVRWLGHRLHSEVNIAVDPELSVERGHEIAKEARHQLLHQLRYLSNATIHVDPATASGEGYHSVT